MIKKTSTTTRKKREMCSGMFYRKAGDHAVELSSSSKKVKRIGIEAIADEGDLFEWCHQKSPGIVKCHRGAIRRSKVQEF